jgi:hypothetical protein
MSEDAKPDSAEEAKPARLEVKVGEVHIVLEGDPEFVTSAYERVRGDITAAMRQAEESAPHKPPDLSETTDKLPVAGDLLWVYRCEDDMRTVYAVQKKKFASTPFARAYGLANIERVYVDDDRILSKLREGARTLWRELEPEGMRRIQEAAEAAAQSKQSPAKGG